MAKKQYTQPREPSYDINLSELQDVMANIYDVGYGETISIKINGEYYNLHDDRPKKIKKV